MARIFGQHATGVAGLGRFPRGLAFLHFRGGNGQVQLPFFRVDGDGVAVFDEGNRAATIRFAAPRLWPLVLAVHSGAWLTWWRPRHEPHRRSKGSDS